MSLASRYTIDGEAAENGKWMVTQEGVEVKVAKLGNKNFKRVLSRLQKPYLAILRSSKGDSELSSRLTTEAMAKTILLDWKETDEKGNPIPYTWKAGYDAFMKYEEFLDDVSDLAASRNNFRPEEIAEK